MDKDNLLHTPEGVRDIIGDELKNKLDMLSRIEDVSKSFGYNRIATPTFEYLDCYSREVGSTPINELYKLFDRNGDILALRPDFTPSIARVSAKYFSDSSVPIKLSYVGSVFKNHASFKGRLCESIQFGAEYIGDSTIEADAEVVATAVKCILASGVDSFKLSIGHSDIFTGLCEACNFSIDEVKEIKSIIINKNVFGLEEYLEKKDISPSLRDAFIKCIRIHPDEREITELIETLSGIDRVSSAILYLQDLLLLLKAYHVMDYVSLDLSLINEYSYYTGIIFLGYTYGSGNAVLSGGRYDRLLSHFGNDAPAIGFAILCDDLFEAIKRQGCLDFSYEIRNIIIYEKKHRIEAIKNAEMLRKKGKITILLQYSSEEELNKYKAMYRNDNLFLITDGKENE